jgi:hypothetical protein
MITFGLLEAVGSLLVLMVIIRILMKDYDLIYAESTSGKNNDTDTAEKSSWLSRFPFLKRADSPETKARLDYISKATIDG